MGKKGEKSVKLNLIKKEQGGGVGGRDGVVGRGGNAIRGE